MPVHIRRILRAGLVIFSDPNFIEGVRSFQVLENMESSEGTGDDGGESVIVTER
jgi:hypothetical protein